MTIQDELAATDENITNPSTNYAIAMNPPLLAERLFGTDLAELDRLNVQRHGHILTEFRSAEARDVLTEIEVLVTGWGLAPLTDDDLDAAPRLRYVIHAGGSAGNLLPPSAGRRGILASNAGTANAIPVAEHTLAMILMANKRAFRAQRLYAERREHIDREHEFASAGNYGQTVGIISASRTGRLVIEHLSHFDLRVLVYDPLLNRREASALGVTKSGLDALMAASDVVSVHTPVLPETIGLIGREQLALMPDGATLINTSRGQIIDQDALVDELASGRIDAVLDVTDPDVLEPTSPLYELPNVFLTPHIAGSMGTELRRLGHHVSAELERITEGKELAFPESLD